MNNFIEFAVKNEFYDMKTGKQIEVDGIFYKNI